MSLVSTALILSDAEHQKDPLLEMLSHLIKCNVAIPLANIVITKNNHYEILLAPYHIYTFFIFVKSQKKLNERQLTFCVLSI